MRYVQLRAFHFVAVAGGFSRAAKLLHLTQPAISDQVRKLESEYDVRLFDRVKKRVTLTEAGDSLFEITKRMFEMENQAHEFLVASQSAKSGRINIIADSINHIIHILEPFRRQNPKVFVSVKTGNTDDVISALNSYDADIGVLGSVPKGREFDCTELSATPIVAIAHIDHEIAQKKSISLRELAGQSLVMREPGSKTRAKFEKFAREQGIPLTVGIEAEGREAVNEIVYSGAGVGIVSDAEFSSDQRLVKIAISDADIIMNEAVFCLRERRENGLIRAFMRMVLDASEQTN